MIPTMLKAIPPKLLSQTEGGAVRPPYVRAFTVREARPIKATEFPALITERAWLDGVEITSILPQRDGTLSAGSWSVSVDGLAVVLALTVRPDALRAWNLYARPGARIWLAVEPDWLELLMPDERTPDDLFVSLPDAFGPGESGVSIKVFVAEAHIGG